MKRFDRAMYAFFLLALLADVARAQVCLPVGGDSGSGLILNAASQLRVGPGSEAPLLPRRANRSYPSITRLKSAGLSLSGWARVLSAQSNSVNPGMLPATAFDPDTGSGSLFAGPSQSASPSQTIFEHTGSPAP